MRQAASGPSQTFLEPKPGRAMAVERSEMTLWLYDAVRKQYPQSVRFFFGSCLTDWTWRVRQ